MRTFFLQTLGVEQAAMPAAVPPEFLKRVKRWAEAQPSPVSVILFGSRARGDYDPVSDWDFALVYDGTPPTLDGLPYSLPGGGIDWVRMDRSRTLFRLNLCGVPNEVAEDGVCLFGRSLPKPERREMNMPDAWYALVQSQERVCAPLNALQMILAPHARAGAQGVSINCQ